MNDAAKTQDTISLRLSGEVSTKSSATRKRFHRRLIQNIRDALGREGIKYKVVDNWYRIDVQTDDLRAKDILSRIFGVQVLNDAHEIQYESLEDLVDQTLPFFKDQVFGKTFAVRTRRAGQRESIPFTSFDVDRAVGAALFDFSAGVSIKNPEVEVGIEVRADKALFHVGDVKGPGGLPSGVEGRALSLISGGFDSAVSSWLMMRRGVDLDFLFFNLGGPEHTRNVITVLKRLTDRWSFGHSPKLHVVDFRPVVAEMKEKSPKKFWQILLKYQMFQAAQYLVRHAHKHLGIVTGEAIGQVSSQTLANLGTIQSGLSSPVFRPLVTYNKDEIIQLARRIGTHKARESFPEFCDLAGGRVALKVSPEDIEPYVLDVSKKMIKQVVQQRRIFTCSELSLDLVEDVTISEVPDGATILDVRAPGRIEKDSIAGAIAIAFDVALEQAQLLPKGPTYVVVCEVGLKSAYVAQIMRAMGHSVFSLKPTTSAE